MASYLSMQVEGEYWRAELANRFDVYDEVMSNHYTPPTQFANDFGQGKFGSRGRGTGGIGADPDPNWVFPIPKPTPDGKFTAEPGKEFSNSRSTGRCWRHCHAAKAVRPGGRDRHDPRLPWKPGDSMATDQENGLVIRWP